MDYTISEVRSHQIRFTHFVDVPSSQCLIATGRDTQTNRANVFLLFYNDGNRVYRRNGLCGTWDELDSENRQIIRKRLEDAIKYDGIPRYTTQSRLN